MSDVNQRHVSYAEIVEDLRTKAAITAAGDAPKQEEFSNHFGAEFKSNRILIKDSRNRATVITSPGGAPGDPHIHPDFNEWFMAFGGVMGFLVGEYTPFRATFGDITVAPCGYRHTPLPWYGDMCMRLVCTKPGSNHDIKGIEPSRNVRLDPDWEPPNRILTPLPYMIERHGLDANWQESVLLDQRNRVEMFNVLPGASAESVNGDSESWWVVLKGNVRFEIAGDVVDASKGSVLYSGDGEFSAITATGPGPGIFVEVADPETC